MDTSSPEVILQLDQEFVDATDEFDETTDRFIPREANYYYFGMSAGIQSGQTVSVSIHGVNVSVSLERQYVRFFDQGFNEMISRDTVSFLNAGEAVTLRSNNQGVASRPNAYQTALFAYELGHVADLSTLFYASASVRQSQAGMVQFDQDHMRNNVFDLASNSYTCRDSDAYIFHISSGLVASRRMRMYLKGMSRSYALARDSTTHNGVDIISRTIVARCTRNEVITMELQEGEIYSDVSDYQLTAIGFRYQPQQALNIAFAGYCSLSKSYNADDILDFNIVEQGGDFGNDFDGSKFIARERGYYYVYYGAAVFAGFDVQLSLIRTRQGSPQELAAITADTRANNGYDSIGRGLIVELLAEDTLHIKTERGVQLYADALGNNISFNGFMLYRI